jgi:hypothetical protein
MLPTNCFHNQKAGKPAASRPSLFPSSSPLAYSSPAQRRPRHGLSPAAVASPAGASPPPASGRGRHWTRARGAANRRHAPAQPAPRQRSARSRRAAGRPHSDQPAGTSGRAPRLPTLPPTRPVSRAIFLQILHRAFGDRPRYPCRSAVPATAAPGAGSHGPSSRGARRPRGQRIYRVSAVARPMAPALGRPDEWRRQFRCRHISA